MPRARATMPSTDAIYRSEKNARDARRSKYHAALDKMQACRLHRRPGDALQACRDAMTRREKSMHRALDAVAVARLCACWAEACLGARLATEASSAAAKGCLRSLPEPWPPKWRFLLAKAHFHARRRPAGASRPFVTHRRIYTHRRRRIVRSGLKSRAGTAWTR